MCGIHGVLAIDPSRAAGERDLRRMGEIARHRGPDDFGDFIYGPLSFGMQRLSIIDVAGGHQPIFNEDETVVVVCNGEIYNCQALREDLKARGHRFRTHSDVEVIVHLYEEYGDDCIEHLRGMFAFALWDRTRSRLLIGRDRTGIKPLYYSLERGRLAFASEAKSILSLPGFSRRLNTQALPHYLQLGYVPAPLTMFEGIEKLPPATLMVMENGQVRHHRYWTMPGAADDQGDLEEWSRKLRSTLSDCVERQMVSDVPLGAFLSGGIDSSAVVAMMSRFSREPVRTFAIGFGGSSGGQFYNELPYARQVAEQFATEHQEIVVEPSVVELLPRLLWHMDEPIADTAFVTTYLVSEFARRDVMALLASPPVDFAPRIEAAFAQVDGSDPLAQMMRVDLATQMPDDLLALTDRMSMATSLECRVPLLDEELIDHAAQMPSRHKIAGRDLKPVLKHALRDDLPREILYRQKRGFGAPMGAWFKRELRPLVDELLAPARIASRGWLNAERVETLRADHDANRADYTDQLVALTNLELWAQIYPDDRGVGDVSEQLNALVAA